MKVLLIDDHQEVRRMLTVGLELHAGIEVVGEAGSAAEGARMAKRLRPQAIVLDLILPDAAPRQAFAAVREAAPTSRVVVYSAKESSRRWFEQQGVRFFGKGTDRLGELVDWFRTEA